MYTHYISPIVTFTSLLIKAERVTESKCGHFTGLELHFSICVVHGDLPHSNVVNLYSEMET